MHPAPLTSAILQLKRERNAVILAHNYQLPEIQDVADFVGDSLDLSRKAAGTTADVVVFCGVHFMAETASILCPDKTVLLPDIRAGCPMADMITAEDLRAKKRELPDAAVVCYVNSSAEVKAESDYCCTSANAEAIVNNLDRDQILFVPDQYLGSYVRSRTGKNIELWPGFCPTHMRIQPEAVLARKKEYPRATVVVHPECRPEVIALADRVLSTNGLVTFAGTSDAEEIIVGTEVGIIHRLSKENPRKRFIPASDLAVCPNMKRITLDKVMTSLRELAPEVRVPEPVRSRARLAVDRMLAAGRGEYAPRGRQL
ncbi:MAG: quinolinate synthase NadA [Dehalococcoidia bacterium]|nr:quinolinate synthase NadA [Dehalococcoidia bacterium]